MEDVWNSILELTSQFVSPDWGATVALIPIALFVLVVLYFSWVGWRYATAGPKVRGGRPSSRARPGVHMPAGSCAPVLVGIGAFFLFLGLVFGGIWLIVGVIVLALTLLYWGREGLTRLRPPRAVPSTEPSRSAASPRRASTSRRRRSARSSCPLP